MEASDLRIGNLITTAHYEDFKTIIEVESLDEVGVNLTAETDNKPYGMHNPLMEREYKYAELFGIPLTEEILLKCGFVIVDFNGIEASLENSRYSVKSVKDYDGWFFCDGDSVLTNFKYLHQLQNLYFALTQTELTINL